MKKAVFLSFLFLIMGTLLFAQKSTFFHVDAGYKGDLYRLTDNGNALADKPVPGGYFGFSLSHELNGHWIVETGGRLINYQFGVTFQPSVSMGLSGSIHSWQIPLLVKYRLHDRNNRFSFTPYAGFALGINRDHTDRFPPDYIMSQGGASLDDGTHTYVYEHSGYTNFRKTFPLFEAGLSLEYRTRWGLQLSLDGAWQGGFKKIMQYDLTYHINEGADHTATYTSNGNNFRITFGIGYAVSRLWEKKKNPPGDK